MAAATLVNTYQRLLQHPGLSATRLLAHASAAKAEVLYSADDNLRDVNPLLDGPAAGLRVEVLPAVASTNG